MTLKLIPMYDVRNSSSSFLTFMIENTERKKINFYKKIESPFSKTLSIFRSQAVLRCTNYNTGIPDLFFYKMSVRSQNQHFSKFTQTLQTHKRVFLHFLFSIPISMAVCNANWLSQTGPR